MALGLGGDGGADIAGGIASRQKLPGVEPVDRARRSWPQALGGLGQIRPFEANRAASSATRRASRARLALASMMR